jgi:hypothetical protein
MTLTRRDAVATAFTGLAALTLVIALAGWNVPLIGDSYRSAAVAAFLLGVGGYLSGRPLQGYREPLLGVLGIVALALAILALATGSAAFLVLLVADTIVLWAATTMRHARAREGRSLPSQG